MLHGRTCVHHALGLVTARGPPKRDERIRLFSEFSSGHSHGERLKAQNERGCGEEKKGCGEEKNRVRRREKGGAEKRNCTLGPL